MKSLVCAVLAVAIGLFASSARATFHTFVISEVYSSVDGSVQFIELKENLNLSGQNLWAGHTLTATSADGTQTHEITFPSNLPSMMTASKRVLVGTANLASIPGGVTPNYIIPAGFLFPGGSVNFAGLAGGADVSYTALPTDGTHSLVFPGGTSATNSPTNFAGATGSLNLPPGRCCSGSSCSLTIAAGCSGAFNSGGSCSPNPCAPPAMGACCGGPACSVSTPAACTGAMVYQGDGSACGPAGNPTTCCRANFNRQGGVTVQDIFDFLAAYFASSPDADFNGQSGVTVQDIFDFLAAYFAGCPG